MLTKSHIGAIGKDGTAGIDASLRSLTLWARRDPFLAEEVAFNAVKTIGILAPQSKGSDRQTINTTVREIDRQTINTTIRDIDTAQYGIVTVFLCHVVLWVFSTVSPEARKSHLRERLARDAEVTGGFGFMDVMNSALNDHNREGDSPKVLFRSAAEMLTRLGTWGASLNMALLLHKRSEM